MSIRSRRALSFGLWGLFTLGTLTSSTLSVAQESTLADARARTKAAPLDAAASMTYGRALLRAGHDTEALTEFRRGVGVLGTSTTKASLLARFEWELARTHIERREFQQALGICRAIAKLPSETAVSHVCIAEAHLLWRRGTEALTELSALSNEQKPGKDVPVDVQYAAKVAEGRSFELASNDTGAESSYRDAMKMDPARIDAPLRLGTLLQRLGKDGTGALRSAVAIDPKDPVAQFELGKALTQGSPESLAAFERAIAERPTFLDAKRALADGYIAAKRLPEAKKVVEEILRVAPNDVGSRVSAGHVALAEGRFDDAIKEGEAANKLMANVAAAKLLVADAWAKKGEIDLALEAYQAAFGLDHSDPTPLVNAVQACLAAKRVTSAKAFAQRATQDFAGNASAWVALGDALTADRDLAGARRAYEAAKKLPNADVVAIDQRLAKLK